MSFQNKKWSLRQRRTNNVIHIDSAENSLVGRNADAKISLNSFKASRSHGTFMINTENNLMVMDLRSVNGTFVNNKAISVHLFHKVFPGDLISFGIGEEEACENEFDHEVFFEVLVEDLPVNNIAPPMEVVQEVSETVQKNFTKKQDKNLKVGRRSKSLFKNIKDTTNNNPVHANSNSSGFSTSLKNGGTNINTGISDSRKQNIIKEQDFDKSSKTGDTSSSVGSNNIKDSTNNSSEHANSNSSGYSSSSKNGLTNLNKGISGRLQKKFTKEQVFDKSSKVGESFSSSRPKNINDSTNNNSEHANSNSSGFSPSSKNGGTHISTGITGSLQTNFSKEKDFDKSSNVRRRSSSSCSKNIKESTNNNPEHANINSSGFSPKTNNKPEPASCSSSGNNSSKNRQKNINGSIHKLDSLLGDLDEFLANSDNSKLKVTKLNISTTPSKNENKILEVPKVAEMSINESIDAHLNSKRSFTTWQDNSIVIELSDDEDVDFSASQIFQPLQIKKERETENRDEVFKKIKNELAEMDFCSHEIICNQIPIDVEDEGFENTQQIFAVLQDDADPHLAGASKNGLQLITNTTSSTKSENINDEILKPHTDNRRSPRTRKKELADKEHGNNDNVAGKNEIFTTSKRKLSIDKTPVGKKKSKPSPKTPPTYKDIEKEIKKRRHSTSKETQFNKEDAEILREERRKKLKELTSPPGSVKKTTETTSEDSALNTKGDSESGVDPLVALNVKKRTSLLSSLKKSPVSTRTAIEIPPPSEAPYRYNLRRAKSSDEIKISRQTEQPKQQHTLASSRHSSHIILNPEPISRSRADPRRQAQANHDIHYKNPISQLPDSHQYTNVFRPQNIWDNVGSFKQRQPRRLTNLDDIIQIMITWLPNWLSEQSELDVSPPINNPPAKRIPNKFKDFDHYYSSFTKLILLETWQYIYNSWELGVADLNRVQRRVTIEHVRIVNNQMNIDCAYYITKEEAKRNDFCKTDDFVTFECVTYDQANTYMQLSFGVVLCSRKRILHEDQLISMRLASLCTGEIHSKIEFTVATRHYSHRDLNVKKWPMMTVITNVKSFMMHIRAMKDLKQSPLCRMITEPKMNDFKFINSYGTIKQQNHLNPQQKTIVEEAVNLCTGNRPGIYCVKGPPGTGKSTVIVNIILEILFSYYENANKCAKQPMILLSAPSNAAVDNLIMKIVNAKRTFEQDEMHHKRNIKLVRIGPESSISKSVIGYSLANLTGKHLPLKNIHVPEIKAALESNHRVLETVKEHFKEQYSQEVKACETLVIKKCNIICTTLNSCINSRLIDCVNKGIIEFTCCIIDEATQCHEPESLLPTMLGIDKFVLVGDPQQLNATVMSNDAIKLGFQNSLFSRLANNFGTDPRSPIKLLTDQYRMHPEICAYPNKHFYNSKLRSFPNPPNRLPVEVRPYLMFNCEKISYSSNDYTNMDEVILIKKLISTIFSVVDKSLTYSIGIITPYNAQKELVMRNISDLVRERVTCKILVNTVDSFQGSENDIIIISCVRHYSNSFLRNVNRLNVALTRAKQALYIIGNYALFKECKPLYDLREDAKKRKVLLDIRQDPRSIGNFHKYLLQKPPNSTGATATFR